MKYVERAFSLDVQHDDSSLEWPVYLISLYHPDPIQTERMPPKSSNE